MLLVLRLITLSAGLHILLSKALRKCSSARWLVVFVDEIQQAGHRLLGQKSQARFYLVLDSPDVKESGCGRAARAAEL